MAEPRLNASRLAQCGDVERVNDSDGGYRIKVCLLNSTGGAVAAGGWAHKSYDSTTKVLAAIALADNVDFHKVLVAAEAIASGSAGWWYVEGNGISATLAASATATAGYGLKLLDGAVVSTGAAFTELDTELGIIEESIESTTACVVTLLGREVLGTT